MSNFVVFSKKALFPLLLTLSQALPVFYIYKPTTLQYLLFLLLFIFRFFLYPHLGFKSNLLGTIYIIYLEASLCFSTIPELVLKPWPSLKEVHSDILKLSLYIVTLGIIFFRLKKRERKVNVSLSISSENLDKTLFCLVILSFIVSFVCYLLGVGVMGQPSPQLPMKIEPALSILRTLVIPCFYSFIFFHYIQNKSKSVLAKALVPFFIWVVVETVLRGSRGVLFFSFLPLILIYLQNFGVQKSGRSLVMFLMLSLVGFIGGDYIRNCYRGKCELDKTS